MARNGRRDRAAVDWLRFRSYLIRGRSERGRCQSTGPIRKPKESRVLLSFDIFISDITNWTFRIDILIRESQNKINISLFYEQFINIYILCVCVIHINIYDIYYSLLFHHITSKDLHYYIGHFSLMPWNFFFRHYY